MNLKLLLEIERHMNNISVDIKQLNIRLDEVVKVLEPLKMQLERHKKEIERMRKKMNEGKKEKDKISEREAEKNYEEKHPEYIQIKSKIEKLTEKKEGLEKDIKRRENFLKILTKCKNRIAKYIKAA